VPEDHFNLAMAQLKTGQLDAAEATWQRVFDLSYAHQDASESSTSFQKKALFAAGLLDAGRPGPLALDLLEQQLLPWFTNYHVTDPSFWGMRGVPALETVLTLLRRSYHGLGKTAEEWRGLCDRVATDVDSEGQATCERYAAEYPA
jgi:hypothetical protein